MGQEGPQSLCRLLGHDAVAERFQLVVAAQPGDVSDVPQWQALHPFDEPGC